MLLEEIAVKNEMKLLIKQSKKLLDTSFILVLIVSKYSNGLFVKHIRSVDIQANHKETSNLIELR